MLDNNRELVNSLIRNCTLIILASSITALLKSVDNMLETLRNWLAGICAGAVCYLVLDQTTISDFVKSLIMIVFSAFISSMYPILETAAKKWIKKKSENV